MHRLFNTEFSLFSASKLFFLRSSVLSRGWLRQINDGHPLFDSPALEGVPLPPNLGQSQSLARPEGWSRRDTAPGSQAQPERARGFRPGALEL